MHLDIFTPRTYLIIVLPCLTIDVPLTIRHIASVRIVARITNKKRIARYVARYIRHPAVSNTRLHRYDGKEVTFWYADREGKRHFVTMEVREFIKTLIQHIPDRNFKMIRYYDAYSRRTKRRYFGSLQRSLRQATFEDFVTKVNKWAPVTNRSVHSTTYANCVSRIIRAWLSSCWCDGI
jgi:hypothetical protein